MRHAWLIATIRPLRSSTTAASGSASSRALAPESSTGTGVISCASCVLGTIVRVRARLKSLAPAEEHQALSARWQMATRTCCPEGAPLLGDAQVGWSVADEAGQARSHGGPLGAPVEPAQSGRVFSTPVVQRSADALLLIGEADVGIVHGSGSDCSVEVVRGQQDAGRVVCGDEGAQALEGRGVVGEGK